jgi:hypothetical protein
MKNLKRNSSLFLTLIVLISGCQSTQNFKMTTLEKEELHIVEINSNRVSQECYFMNAEKENSWRHQYALYMLNENQEVIPVYNPTNQSKDECMAHLKKVERVLKNESRVKLCVRDKLEKRTDKETVLIPHDFGPLGKFKSTYKGLTFDTICSSQKCHSISDTWTRTCPGFKR